MRQLRPKRPDAPGIRNLYNKIQDHATGTCLKRIIHFNEALILVGYANDNDQREPDATTTFEVIFAIDSPGLAQKLTRQPKVGHSNYTPDLIGINIYYYRYK